ncbi:calponin homology domain-containing protein [Piptocephalis cylindrospora]|uniref:Fimbrin n=1 Tax=Piptocephalis cylindrospora TaxID=1907219 RepID=A0A4P9XYQ5_9FUNG|nr:calponin homology domain-containing protein [Piptocephalis cylindrospora]|eukprot:RKP11504.1 calponin homology domain-containing protein [Piptocephalis cylindrospora]
MVVNVDSSKLKWKFPVLSKDDIDGLVEQFNGCSLDTYNNLEERELIKLCQSLPGKHTYDEVRGALKHVDISTTGKVDVEEFLEVVAKLREGGSQQRTILTGGKHHDTTHSIDQDEKAEFTKHINYVLADDPHIGTRFPLDTDTMQLFDECTDGLILSKLINDSAPDTIDERVLNVGAGAKRLNAFQITENNNVVINSAKAIGCNVVNIGSQDLAEGREHLILGLIWQIIKKGLLARVDIKIHPELYRLLEEDETLEDLLRLPADQILLRWFNYHLKAAGWSRTVGNFSSDVKDGENYTVLLAQLVPSECSRAPLQEKDLLRRAEMILESAGRIGCRKYLTPKTMVSGNPRLNLAFVAHLFNTHPGLEALTEQEQGTVEDNLFDSEDDREARAFALWLNSLGVDPFINYLFEDLQDGLILLQAIDRIHPGLVDWKRKVTTKTPVTSRFKRVENTNYVVMLGKHLGYSLVGIQGADITDGSRTLTLALVWQLMREHVVQTLKKLSRAGKEVTDADMIEWANATAKKGGLSPGGKGMTSFKDPSLKNGIFLLDLLNGMSPGIVDASLVAKASGNEEDWKMNSKYAISIARKLGATIFLLPEDIVEVKPKMILTFVGSLMAVAQATS